MSDFNCQNNRAVWIDIPVIDLDRACPFYSAILDCKIDAEEFDGCKFAVIEHEGRGVPSGGRGGASLRATPRIFSRSKTGGSRTRPRPPAGFVVGGLTSRGLAMGEGEVESDQEEEDGGA